MATQAAVIAHIAKHPEGLLFGEIQRFIVEANGLDYDKKVLLNRWDGKPVFARQYRGYWCDQLLSGSIYQNRVGILDKFCIKVGKRYIAKKDA